MDLSRFAGSPTFGGPNVAALIKFLPNVAAPELRRLAEQTAPAFGAGRRFAKKYFAYSVWQSPAHRAFCWLTPKTRSRFHDRPKGNLASVTHCKKSSKLPKMRFLTPKSSRSSRVVLSGKNKRCKTPARANMRVASTKRQPVPHRIPIFHPVMKLPI